MIPFAILAALKAIPWRVLTFMGGVIVVLVLIAMIIRLDGQLKREKAARARTEIELGQRLLQIDALEQAAMQRAVDSRDVEDLRKGLEHAIDTAPAGDIGPATRAANCQRLRNAGFTGAKLPEPCRSGG